MKDLGLLFLRLVAGGLLAGHGAQKLFGWFGGHGPKGTAGWLESMGIRPGQPFAIAAGASEFGGGVLTALGLLSPLGPIGVIASMITASGTAHKGKPIWATEGGAELPAVNIAVASGLILTGPGRYSVDALLRTRVPPMLALLAAATAAAGVAMAISRAQQHAEAQQRLAEDQSAEQHGHEPPAAASQAQPPEATPITAQAPALPIA